MPILIAEAPGEVTESEETMDPSPIASQSSCDDRSPWYSSDMGRCTPICSGQSSLLCAIYSLTAASASGKSIFSATGVCE